MTFLELTDDEQIKANEIYDLIIEDDIFLFDAINAMWDYGNDLFEEEITEDISLFDYDNDPTFRSLLCRFCSQIAAKIGIEIGDLSNLPVDELMKLIEDFLRIESRRTKLTQKIKKKKKKAKNQWQAAMLMMLLILASKTHSLGWTLFAVSVSVNAMKATNR